METASLHGFVRTLSKFKREDVIIMKAFCIPSAPKAEIFFYFAESPLCCNKYYLGTNSTDGLT